MAKITMVHTDIDTLSLPASGTSLFILDELSGQTVAKLLHSSGLVTILGIESNTGTTDLTGLYHDNRADLDLVSGTNTGDQDLSPYWTSGQTETYLTENYYTSGQTDTLLTTFQLMSDRGIPDGYVPLNSGGTIDAVFIGEFNTEELTGITIYTDLITGYSVSGCSVSFGTEEIELIALSGDLNTDYKISSLLLSKNDIAIQYADLDSTSPTYGQGLKIEKENFGWKIASTDSVIPSGLINVVIVGTTGVTASKSNTTYLGDINVNGQDINFNDYVTSGGYYTTGQTNELLEQYSLTSHTHSQYLTGDTFWESYAVDTPYNYGNLYNWYAVNTGILAPTGWRVISTADFNSYLAYIGANDLAINSICSDRYDAIDTVPVSSPFGTLSWSNIYSPFLPTDQYGISLIPSGWRQEYGYFAFDIDIVSLLFSDNTFTISNDGAFYIVDSTDSPHDGYHIRCIRDTTPAEDLLIDGTYVDDAIDIDGNAYKAIKIGSQVWMSQNLKVSKYNDGTPIPNITDNETWRFDTTGAYCTFNNLPLSTYEDPTYFYTTNATRIKPKDGKKVDAADVINLPSSSNIGNSDLTLTGNRVLTIGSYSFTLNDNISDVLKVYADASGTVFVAGISNTYDYSSTIIGHQNSLTYYTAYETVIGTSNTVAYNSNDYVIGDYNLLDGDPLNEGGQNYVFGSGNSLYGECFENTVLGKMNSITNCNDTILIGSYLSASNLPQGQYAIGNAITIPDAEVSTSTLYTNSVAVVGQNGDGAGGIVRFGFEDTEDTWRFRKDGSTLSLEVYDTGVWVVKDSWTK